MSKEKQIEEIAKLICSFPQCVNYNIIGGCKIAECQTVDTAECLYNAGYRKQSEGEWKKPSRYSEPICTICKKSPCQYFGMLPPFCPNCGAKMKGGAE